MKKTMYVSLAILLCVGSLCTAMEKAVQVPALDKQDLWVQYQGLSQLTEKQQKLLIALAQKSTLKEMEELMRKSRAVAKSAAAIVAGLEVAKTARDANRAWRRWRLWNTDIELLSTDIAELTSEQIEERLSIVSTLDEKDIQEMLEQAPQAKTNDLEELITRFGTIQQQLTQFSAAIESMKTSREKEQLEAEKQSTSEVERLKKEAADAAAQAGNGDTCTIC